MRYPKWTRIAYGVAASLAFLVAFTAGLNGSYCHASFSVSDALQGWQFLTNYYLATVVIVALQTWVIFRGTSKMPRSRKTTIIGLSILVLIPVVVVLAFVVAPVYGPCFPP